MAPRLFEPTDAAGVAAVLQSAAADRLSVTVRGGGTKSPTQGLGAESSLTSGLLSGLPDGLALAPGEIVLSTMRLTGGVDHVAGDLVATAPAGVTLDAVNAALRRE